MFRATRDYMEYPRLYSISNPEIARLVKTPLEITV